MVVVLRKGLRGALCRGIGTAQGTVQHPDGGDQRGPEAEEPDRPGRKAYLRGHPPDRNQHQAQRQDRQDPRRIAQPAAAEGGTFKKQRPIWHGGQFSIRRTRARSSSLAKGFAKTASAWGTVSDAGPRAVSINTGVAASLGS